MDSISISDLFNPSRDKVMYGSCCESIGIIDQEPFQGNILHCFKVESKEKTWTICDENAKNANDWRVALITDVIIYGLK